MKTRNLLFILPVALAVLTAAARDADKGKPEESAARVHGGSSTETDAHGNTPLHQAMISGNAETAKALLDNGADANARNAHDATPLMLAAGDLRKTRLLLSRGADVNARSALGNTPLILAARRYGASKAVALLLERGADVNATNVYGANAILTAAGSGDLDTVKLLIDKGVDVNSQSRASEDVVFWGGGRSPLMWAALHGDLPMMRVLLKYGAKVNEQEGFGTALTQAAWMDRPDAAALLLKHGADVNAQERFSGYTALHWAASSENGNAALTKLLLKYAANPNAEGGEPVDAFMGVPRTPLMLARKRGDTDIARTLAMAGAKAPETREKETFVREVTDGFDAQTLRRAIERAMPPLRKTALSSRDSYLKHASKQDCVSCHQQYLPLVAMSIATASGQPQDAETEQAILEMVRRDGANRYPITIETTFHPEPAHAYGYELFALAAQNEPRSAQTDASVHHLLAIQGKDGQWFNNLPRPPIQTSDVGATALAIHGLARFGPPGREAEIQAGIARARHWLGHVQAHNTEERVYQILGLIWAGEQSGKLAKFTAALRKTQHSDGGWSQLATLASDAYATGQALYALKFAGISSTAPEFRRGLKFLLATQRDDGTWFIARRAFPFQPTMNSGYPYGRDGWVSASGASWAVIALSVATEP